MGPMSSPHRLIAARRYVTVVPAAALVLSGLVAGCGGEDDTPAEGSSSTPTPSETASDSPSPSESASKSAAAEKGAEVDVEVMGDSVKPVAEKVEIGVGETVTLHITSDRAGELHIHSSPEQEKEFGPGKTDVKITIDKPGSVDVEEHESESLIVRILVS